MKPPGIVNFWQQEDPDNLREQERKTHEPRRFEGAVMVIEIAVLRGKSDTDEELDTQAHECLGTFLRALASPEFTKQLERQRVGYSIPMNAKITFAFPGVTLYAEASSTDSQTAVARAVDRLALAISYTEAARDLMPKYGIAIRRKL